MSPAPAQPPQGTNAIPPTAEAPPASPLPLGEGQGEGVAPDGADADALGAPQAPNPSSALSIAAASGDPPGRGAASSVRPSGATPLAAGRPPSARQNSDSLAHPSTSLAACSPEATTPYTPAPGRVQWPAR